MAETAKGVSSEAALGVVEAPRESGSTPATLLLIVGEPFNIDQKDLILERIVTGKSVAGILAGTFSHSIAEVVPDKTAFY